MTFQEFMPNFDYEDSIVLLEGKRVVLENDKEKLTVVPKQPKLVDLFCY